MAFSKEEIFRHIQSLSFPRRCGTPGEERAFHYIYEHFKKCSFECDIQTFHFSSFLFSILQRIIPLVILTFLSLAAYNSSINHTVTFFFIGLALGFFYLTARWNLFSERIAGFQGRQKSKNIIAKIPNDQAQKEFIFLAHYDSKSQTVPISWRVAGMFIFLFSSLASMMGTIGIAMGVSSFDRRFLIYPLALCLISIFPSLINFKGNNSPGAIDNASGVALLLELARVIQNKKDKESYAYTFIATGAEEEGLFGSFHFIKTYKEKLKKRKTFFINFDGAGAAGKITILDRYGIPPRKTSIELWKLALNAARKNQIDISRGYLPPGTGVDTIPIAYHGFDAITFSSKTLSRALFSIHSSEDVPENISLDSLEELAKLTLALCDGKTSIKVLQAHEN